MPDTPQKPVLSMRCAMNKSILRVLRNKERHGAVAGRARQLLMEIGVYDRKSGAVAGAPGLLAQLLMFVAGFFRPGAVQLKTRLQQYLRLEGAAEGIAFIEDAGGVAHKGPAI